MTDADYSATQTSLGILAAQVRDLDLDGFLERIRAADSAGPIVDPTLYRKASRQLHALKRLAEALTPFQKEVKAQLREEERRAEEILARSSL